MSSREFLRRSHRTVDQWLEKLGFYRKCIARDETCLFRIVAEQLYNTQTLHMRVREEVLQYMEIHRDILSHFVQGDYDDYMERLRNHLVICGDVEISIVSLLYSRDIIIFEPKESKIINVTDRNLDEKFLLCKTTDDHFDGVFRLSYIENSAFCQSLVYENLYEKVFGVQDTSIIVDLMLHYESDCSIIETNNNECGERGKRLHAVQTILTERNRVYDENISDSLRKIADEGLAPFSFKVAKALDPTIYRNIEFDAWNDTRKEIRYNQWYKGGEDLTEGVRCFVNIARNNENFKYLCYIQKLSEQCRNGRFEGDEPCTVYIEDLAEICTVRRDQLEPLPHAAPWPLPLKTYKHLYKENLYNKKLKTTTKIQKVSKACKTLDFTNSPDSPRAKQKIKVKKDIIDTLNSLNAQGNNIEYITMPAYITNQCQNYQNEEQTEIWNENFITETTHQISENNFTPHRSSLTSTYTAEYSPVMNTISNVDSRTNNSYVVVDPNSVVDCPSRPFEPVNYNVARSQLINGSDLPYHDIPTLRFFFNIGLDYFRNLNSIVWHTGNNNDTAVHNQNLQMLPTSESPQMVSATPTAVWSMCGNSQVIFPHHITGIDVRALPIELQHLSLNDENGELDHETDKIFNSAKKSDEKAVCKNNRQWNKIKSVNGTKQSPNKTNWQYNSPIISRNTMESPNNPYNSVILSQSPPTSNTEQISTSNSAPEYNSSGYYTHFVPPESPQNFMYAPPDILQPFIFPGCFQPSPYNYTDPTVAQIPYNPTQPLHTISKTCQNNPQM